eukprot:11510624-Heterocapsa_arctica.AAC.1
MQGYLAEMLELDFYIHDQITSISKSDRKFEDKKPIEKLTHRPGDIFISPAVKTCDCEHQLGSSIAFDPNGGWLTLRSS